MHTKFGMRLEINLIQRHKYRQNTSFCSAALDEFHKVHFLEKKKRKKMLPLFAISTFQTESWHKVSIKVKVGETMMKIFYITHMLGYSIHSLHRRVYLQNFFRIQQESQLTSSFLFIFTDKAEYNSSSVMV